MVDPALMCRQHLLGEHVELHMFVGSINAGKDMTGFLEGNLLEIDSLWSRHDELVEEMTRRGMQHRSPLGAIFDFPHGWKLHRIDAEASLKELLRRCERCADNQRKA